MGSNPTASAMFKSYLSYLSDNPKGYWFKARLYGWGWTPVKWQGWLVVVAYISSLVLLSSRTDSNSHLSADTFFELIVPFILLTAMLIAICFWKGEKPKWRWGK